jgi:hypothetical protein
MSELALLQSRMAHGLIGGRYDALAGALRAGSIATDEALDIHRNTATGGLIKALRLSHPTVLALVGDAFFDQMAAAYVRTYPPTSPWLTGYGASFADVLAGDLPYLADVARLDFALEAVAADALGIEGAGLDLGDARLTLDRSLRLIALDYPAAAIRDAVEDDPGALPAIDVAPRRHALALWRAPGGARLRAIGPLAEAFLSALLGGGDIEAALGDADPSTLVADVFTAPFARLTLMEENR